MVHNIQNTTAVYNTSAVIQNTTIKHNTNITTVVLKHHHTTLSTAKILNCPDSRTQHTAANSSMTRWDNATKTTSQTNYSNTHQIMIPLNPTAAAGQKWASAAETSETEHRESLSSYFPVYVQTLLTFVCLFLFQQLSGHISSHRTVTSNSRTI